MIADNSAGLHRLRAGRYKKVDAMMNSGVHPDREILWRVAIGKASEQEIGDIVGHLDSCDACAKEFDSLSLAKDSAVADLRGLAKADAIANRLKGDADTIPLGSPVDQEIGSLETPSHSILEDASRPFIGFADGSMPDQLGDYRLVRQLGRGGMGVVYQAVHLKQSNLVALKLLPRLTGSTLHRFKREFRAVAQTNHPNLIGLHTLESDHGKWFFTMDLIQGTTFLDYVRPDGLLDEPRLRSALSQLVRGVTALHEAHIIHRDLKPSNVMVTHDGHLVVLDFGLVLEQDSAWVNESNVTIAGTPAYMAPEQAAGGVVNEGSDWYAVGAMLYEALSGQPPFVGSNLKILQVKQQLAAPLLSDDLAIPKDLAELCQSLLATDPCHRPNALKISNAIASNLAPVTETVTRAETPMVGREPQLAALQENIEHVSAATRAADRLHQRSLG